MSEKISACLLLASIILQSAVIFGQQECGDDLFCFQKPYDYPSEEKIDELLRKYKMPNKPDYDDEEIEKLTYEVDDDMNCSTEVRMREPFQIRDENRSYPVIQSTYFTQRIRDVSCKNRYQSCFKDISLVEPYKATCETEQGSIQLYVLDGDEVKIMPATFNCCCKCTIRNTMG